MLLSANWLRTLPVGLDAEPMRLNFVILFLFMVSVCHPESVSHPVSSAYQCSGNFPLLRLVSRYKLQVECVPFIHPVSRFY